MNDCCRDLKKLQRDFKALLIANGNSQLKQNPFYKNKSNDPTVMTIGYGAF